MTQINAVRVDCTPSPYISDLQPGSKIVDGHYIRREHFTVRYTYALYFNIYIKSNFSLVLYNLYDIVSEIRNELNKFKVTPVERHLIKITNIQGNGLLTNKIKFDRFDKICHPEVEIVEVGEFGIPQTIPWYNERVPSKLNSLVLGLNKSTKIKIFHKGYYTIIANNSTNFNRAILTLKRVLEKQHASERFD